MQSGPQSAANAFDSGRVGLTSSACHATFDTNRGLQSTPSTLKLVNAPTAHAALPSSPRRSSIAVIVVRGAPGCSRPYTIASAVKPSACTTGRSPTSQAGPVLAAWDQCAASVMAVK